MGFGKGGQKNGCMHITMNCGWAPVKCRNRIEDRKTSNGSLRRQSSKKNGVAWESESKLNCMTGVEREIGSKGAAMHRLDHVCGDSRMELEYFWKYPLNSKQESRKAL